MSEGADLSPRSLAPLLAGIPDVVFSEDVAGLLVRGLSTDSRDTTPGDVFFAIPGTGADGHDFASGAVRRGAIAVVAERALPGLGAPVVRVPDARSALAEAAAAWYDRPAEDLRLVGITGTMGKTSILKLLEALMADESDPFGIVGSLGIHYADREEDTGGLTTPGPIVLQRALAAMRAAGVRTVAMEVTSHALVQRRVEGLRFHLGIFTNVALLEHGDYHESFEAYVRAKERFFDHLHPGAPLIYAGGDRVLDSLLAGRSFPVVSCAGAEPARVLVHRLGTGVEGTRFALEVKEALPRPAGTGDSRPPYGPGTVEISSPLLGRANIMNAALAAIAALCLGVPPDRVRRLLAAHPAPRRRMEILRRDGPVVLDDTVGHPDSITAVFEVASDLTHRGIHVVFAIRGRRGADINRLDASALAVWADRTGVDGVVVTTAADETDELNRVEPEERRAFLGELEAAGLQWEEHDALRDAVEAALDAAGEEDLVLLLGAQGMNGGRDVVEDWFGRRQRGPAAG